MGEKAHSHTITPDFILLHCTSKFQAEDFETSKGLLTSKMTSIYLINIQMLICV